MCPGYTTPGYLDNPEETAKALRSNGFFDTGDLRPSTATKAWLFHARLKEVIKSGGINISPVEVEQLIVGHPDIQRRARRWGIRPKRGGGGRIRRCLRSADRQAVRDYVKEQAAAFKAPHHVLFRKASSPRLASGGSQQRGGRGPAGIGVAFAVTLSGKATVVGVGASTFERRPNVSVLEMAGEALSAALRDAALAERRRSTAIVHIGSPRGADYDMAQTFGLEPRFCSQTWPPGRFTATVIAQAAMAIACGLATRVACLLAMKNSDLGRIGGQQPILPAVP